MEKHIFISYSTHDSELAFKIVQYLESNGHPCWIAPRNIGSGMDYTDVINSAIEECSAFVLVFSSHSVQSQFVKKELTTAVSFNKTILPFRISNVELKGGFLFLLNNVQWIDATSHPENKPSLILDGLNDQTELPPQPLSLPTKKKSKTWIVAEVAFLVVAIALLGLLLSRSGSSPDIESPENLPGTAVVEDTLSSEPASPVECVRQEKTSPKEQKKAKVEEKHQLVKETPKVKTEEKTDTVHKQPAVEKSVKESHADKMYKVNTYYNKGKYGAALKLLEEMKKENPSDSQLDDLINKCREKL